MTLRHILYSAIFIFVLPSDVVVRDRNTHIQVQQGSLRIVAGSEV